MEEQKTSGTKPPADVSQVARDAHERAGIGSSRPFAGLAGGTGTGVKKLRTRVNRKTAPPEDLAAARERMEQSILDRRKAMAHCPMCGAQGRWKTDSVKKPLRYLICTGCGVGRVQIAVMPEEVDEALGRGPKKL